MKSILFSSLLFVSAALLAQSYSYEPSEKYPYGRPNPEGPKELADYEPMIGECECKSVSRIDQNTWADTVMMTWKWEYIMDGWGVQDKTLKSDGAHSGSIRQYNADSARWYVHYYTSSGFASPLSTWEGNREDGKIVLYRDSPAPNGTPGFYRLTFSDFSDEGYNWVGEWVNKAETFSYPTWKIFCRRE